MRKQDYFDIKLKTNITGDFLTLVPDTCLSKAEWDEPIFVLRAKDPVAADVVDIWATLASKHYEFEKIQSAESLANDMRRWLVADMERRLAE